MKAITLWQPYAGAMALGLKRNETRPRRFHYRGDLCIHSAVGHKHGDAADNLRAVLRVWSKGAGNEALFVRAMTPGAILCVVKVRDNMPAPWLTDPDMYGVSPPALCDMERSLGDYSRGRYAILTYNLRLLLHPVPCRGFQAMPWTVPPEVEARVRAELAAHQAEGAR